MAFTEGLCEKVQEALNNTTTDKPSTHRTQTGYLDAIQSGINTAGAKKVPIDPGTGKKKTVRLTYIKRHADETELITTKKTDCSTDVEPAPFEEDVEITSYLGTPGIKFDRAQMRKLCQPDSEYMQEQMMAHINTLIVGLNKKLITAQAANFGDFMGGDTFKVVTLLKNSDSKPNFHGEAEIMEHFADVDWSGKPIVVGMGNLALYARQVGIGCCNDAGLNLAQAGNLNFFRDRFVEGILGANAFVGLVPGMVQLLTFNEYVGDYAAEEGTFTHGTIVDPVSGLKIDLRWHFNDCDDTFSLNLGLWYKLHFIPTDAYASTDDLNNFNGSLKFVGVKMDDYGCCA
jgi:hypothetical protein